MLCAAILVFDRLKGLVCSGMIFAKKLGLGSFLLPFLTAASLHPCPHYLSVLHIEGRGCESLMVDIVQGRNSSRKQCAYLFLLEASTDVGKAYWGRGKKEADA